MRVALTQSEGRLAGLAEALAARGYEVLRLPLVRTEPLLGAEVRVRAESLLACPWLLFTSPAAVRAWLALRLPLAGHIGSVGQGTARALREAGAALRLVAEPQHAMSLASAFLQDPEAQAPVGLPRGDRALPTLQEELEKAGYETRPVVIYRTLLNDFPADNVDVVVLSSPSAVEALPEAVGKRARLIALGPSTGAAIAESGWDYVQAERPDVTALLAALETVTFTTVTNTTVTKQKGDL